jgi:hypothetical protein|tara:strand:- start:361 stop:669 length:309 start_codon:yes stop_codon:yes gene_type:complete
MQIKDIILSNIKSHSSRSKSDAPPEAKDLTQEENIKRYLEGMNMITPLYALNVYGCFRLSAIIYNLRKEGMDIVTEFVTFGNKTFACYMLKERYEEIQEEAS